MNTLPTCPTSIDEKRVLLIGVDGLRADAAAMLPLPNLHRLSLMGTHTYWAKVQSTGTAISGPGWASLLTGYEPTNHDVDSNGDLTDISKPNILKLVKDQFGMKVAATVSWDPLIDDIIDYQDSSTLPDNGGFKYNSDQDVTDKALEWINNDDFDFIFVDLDQVDGTGHSNGFDGYDGPYANAVKEMDEKVGSMLDAVIANSDGKEWLIVLTTDHGGDGYSHGPQNNENRRIPFFVASNSPRVNIGIMPEDDTGSHMDVVPTILFFLGGYEALPYDLDMAGQVFGFRDYRRRTKECSPDNSTCSCEPDQSDYRGTIARTINNRTCQAWDSQSPHSHTRTPEEFPNSGLTGNFCRNPDGEPGAWCYTTDENIRFELCNVPTCSTKTVCTDSSEWKFTTGSKAKTSGDKRACEWFGAKKNYKRCREIPGALEFCSESCQVCTSTGIQVCEDRAMSKATCDMVSCCSWNANLAKCESAVGNAKCFA